MKAILMVRRSQVFSTIISHLQKPDTAALHSAFLFCSAKYMKKGVPDVQSFARAKKAALLVSQWNVDTKTVIATLCMYLDMETLVTFRHIQNLFGGEVALMIRNYRAIKKLPYLETNDEEQASLLQHMVLSETRDSRALIMCMVDLLLTLQAKNGSRAFLREQANIALNVFVPIAHRIQLGTLKKELEDAAFSVEYPKKYTELKKYVDAKLAEVEISIQEIQNLLQKDLEKSGIRITIIQGRIKSLYRLWQKLQTHEDDLENIHDIIAARVIVPDIASCYKAQKIIQKHFKESRKPKDYIQAPKENGYRSLHVFISFKSKAEIELQIRSNKMHYEAEYGHPAHWLYASKNAENFSREERTLVEMLLKSHRSDHRVRLFPESIFVRDNVGKILRLPKNATCFDFIEHYGFRKTLKTLSMTIDGKVVELFSQLHNGARLEVRALTKESIPQQPQ